MASYIPYYGKKRAALAACERAFAAAIQSEVNAAKLAQNAEQVRDAQVRALRAKLAQLAPSEKNALAIAHIDQEINFWKRLSTNAIIAGYRAGKLQGHRSSEVRRMART